MRSTILSVAAMAATANAHAWMHGIWVNGEDQGDGRKVYIRTPENNSPVKDLASPDLACNVNGGTEAPEFVTVNGGDTISTEWFHDNRDDDIIDGSHKGPIITYIAKYTEGSDGTGPIWSKIAEKGYEGGRWAIDEIKENHGLSDFVLPASIAPGKYLLRQEIIAHHESEVGYNENPARGAQFYPSCVQVEVASGGTAEPDQDFDFNTGYTYADPGIVGVNVYGTVTSYEIPGPEIWTGGSGSGSGNTPSPTTPDEGEDPESTGSPVTNPAPTGTSSVAPSATGSPVTNPAPTGTSSVAPSATASVTPENEPETPYPPPAGGNPPVENEPVEPPAACPRRKRSLKRSARRAQLKKRAARN